MNGRENSFQARAAVAVQDLSKTYWFLEKEAGLSGSLRALLRGKKVFVEAVRQMNLRIQSGEIVGFIGPNGAGKTTTLKMLSGILHPTSGKVEVLGFVPHRREKAFLKQMTFVTGQRNRLFWDLPAAEYFQFCRVMYEIPEVIYHRNLHNLIAMAEIGDILKVPQRKLSAGQRKRCEIVAAFLHDPKVIFLDEPTIALDLINARKIREFIGEKGKEGDRTILLTSHNMADIEQVCPRVIIINQGKIAFDGPTRDLYLLKGFQKQIRIVLEEPRPANAFSGLGQVREMNGPEVWLEVEPARAASIASHLFAHFPVKDIAITDPPLEKIIESIYKTG